MIEEEGFLIAAKAYPCPRVVFSVFVAAHVFLSFVFQAQFSGTVL
jgi:hypothetical protein